MWASSVDVGGPLVDRLAKACAERGVHLAIGVNEREDDRPGSLYNTLLVIGPDGRAAPAPQAHADDARAGLPRRRAPATTSTSSTCPASAGSAGSSAGRTACRWPGGACTRAARRSGWRPTADDSDGWIASMRHIAIEAGAFVVSVPQYIPASAFPDDFPLPLPEGVDVLRPRRRLHRRRPTARCSPGRSTTSEGIVIADCDLREALHAKRYFDVAGHYGRADVLDPDLRPLPLAKARSDLDLAPTSNTRSGGRLKNRLALSAPRCSSMYRCSRAGCMP